MEYELRLTTLQLHSLENVLFNYVVHDCKQIIEMIENNDNVYLLHDIKHHGDMCSDVSIILEKIKKSRESGKK